MLRMVRSDPPFVELAAEIRGQMYGTDAVTQREAAQIVEAVRERGDAALVELTHRFDAWAPDQAGGLRVAHDEIEGAYRELPVELRTALEGAAANIRRFHERQREDGYAEFAPDGTLLAQRVTALTSVGIYVPGGRAAYPSSVLMNAIPAQVAGVDRVVMVTPAPGGELNLAVLAAARIAGVSEVFRVGGAQAVAALAFGTATVPAVDKVVGPGNRWVAEAKRQLFGRIDIDMVAGPSEVMVIADRSAPARYVAADLLAQAEHDPDAVCWLVTTSQALLDALPAALATLLAENPRAEVARAALRHHGLAVLVPDLAAAAALANLKAPEHLELLVAEPLALAGAVRNAGAIFLGGFTPESVGDYYAGPNHVLPTGGTARWASPLGVYDFVKRTSIIGYSRERLLRDGPDVIRLAHAEGLPGHAAAVRVRLEELAATRPAPAELPLP